MKNKVNGIIFSIIVAGSFLGCSKASEKEVVIVSIGKTKVTISDFNERLANLPQKYREIIQKRKNEYLQELINDTLLYQEAVRQNIHKDKDVLKVLDEARKKILIARLLKDNIDDVVEITEDDVKEYYGRNKMKYMTPRYLRVAHVLSSSREDSENILAELQNGADFADMARAKSIDPTAQNGGDIGYFPIGQLMPEFENACVGLAIGETSDVVRTKLGYHIIKLTGRREPELKSVQKVRDTIRSELHTKKRQKIFNELLARLRDNPEIQINKEALSSQ
ncbi:MAG: peptidylprolyl isomerase [Candidatus Omnitrophota bacterium]